MNFQKKKKKYDQTDKKGFHFLMHIYEKIDDGW